MKKDRAKGFIFGVVLTLMLVSTVGVFASGSLGKNIEVFYNNIKLVVDGDNVEFDKGIEPFIYEGTTYLPVRAVGDAVGKKVDWDGATQTVYLGKKNKNDEDATYIGNGIEHMNYQESNNANGSEFFNYVYNSDKAVFDNIGNKYYSYITLGMSNSWNNSYPNSWNYLDFPTNGQYKTFKTTLAWPDDMKGNDEDVEVSIYADDKLIYETVYKPGAFPEDINLDISGALKVRIKTSIPEYTKKCFVGFYNPRFIKK